MINIDQKTRFFKIGRLMHEGLNDASAYKILYLLLGCLDYETGKVTLSEKGSYCNI